MPKLEYGLSILELVIVIAIISLLGTVSIPALRNFNNNQQLNNTVLDFKNALRSAQSKAASSIKCSNNTPSVKWVIEIPAVPANQFKTIPYCDSGGGTIVADSVTSTLSTVPLPSDITILSTGCQQLETTDLIFQKQILSVECAGTPKIGGAAIKFQSTKLKGSNDIKNINISQGGIFSD